MHERWPQPHGDADLSAFLMSLDRFCLQEIRPNFRKITEEARFPYEIMSGLSELGLFLISIPEAYGGVGWNTQRSAWVGRRLAYESGGMFLNYTVGSTLSVLPIALSGSDDQKWSILPRVAVGRNYGCFMLSEENGGSDPRNMSMRAKMQPDGSWKLNGRKTWITGAGAAHFGIVLALTETKRFSAFLIQHDLGIAHIPGVTITKIAKRVHQCAPFYSVQFDDVTLPPEAVIGIEGDGYGTILGTLDGGRIGIGVQAIGMGERVYDDAFAYASERKLYGKKLIELDGVRRRFERAERMLNHAWSMTLEAARLRDAGAPHRLEAARAKLVATEIAFKVADNLMRSHGAMGYVAETDYLQWKEDIDVTRVYEGPNEVMRYVIASEEAKRRQAQCTTVP
ncbi:acyl-CoA dehydrogenase [Candidatus Kaiserbacteria bacterium]|nr:acyl-CoA dehydrogenase [Candidatus Kaiserbacteria bacterium]